MILTFISNRFSQRFYSVWYLLLYSKFISVFFVSIVCDVWSQSQSCTRTIRHTKRDFFYSRKSYSNCFSSHWRTKRIVSNRAFRLSRIDYVRGYTFATQRYTTRLNNNLKCFCCSLQQRTLTNTRLQNTIHINWWYKYKFT